MTRETRGLPLVLVGCDFRTASSAWRERLRLSSEERRELAERLRSSGAGLGLVALDTCNRTEWLTEAPDPEWAAQLLCAWMTRLLATAGTSRLGSLPTPYVQVREAAAQHHVRVTLGLESLVPGEREIAGQCNRAFSQARAERTSSPLLNLLSQSASRTVRRVERLCSFRDASRGVHALAADYIAAHVKDRNPLRVGVVGMGEIGSKTAAFLDARGCDVLRFNRTISPERVALWLRFEDLPLRSRGLDAVIVCTAASEPTVDAARLSSEPREAPLLVLDLGMPGQVLRECVSAGTVTVAGLDDLVRCASDTTDAAARASAEEAVTLGVEELVTAWRRRRAAHLLAAAQESRERLAAEELPALLDAHLPDLPDARRRRLEADLRDLLLRQQRQFVREVGASVSSPATQGDITSTGPFFSSPAPQSDVTSVAACPDSPATRP